MFVALLFISVEHLFPEIVLAKDFLQLISKTKINKLDFGPFPLINFTQAWLNALDVFAS